ncbi:MAG: TIGR03960 family B12-binding radical SAM protein, partial [Candidatus Omnitrophica bacterium]|nr:TIGR03960 family B12-binding radical SAM protein [Candidatus Omnitrophota bacterium]
MDEDILLQVNKPARYIGKEWNLPEKNFEAAEIRFALCFADLYEIGMSNLGLRIIYSILNNMPDVCCERFFSCNQDMEKILRNRKLEIFSLESKRALREFDLVGFSLASELNYTNVLNILDLGSVPLRASLRDHRHPLVIGGGPCSLNPEPLSEFFDIFVIGEAEEAIVEVIDVYRKYKEKYKNASISKPELLNIFSEIKGVYAPSLYEVHYDSRGKIKEFKPKAKGIKQRVEKRIVLDLNNSFFPVDWLVPYVQIVHDRVSLEVMRGCPNRCRFCQARSQYFPFRQRDPDNLLNLAKETQRRTGYEEIALTGLSVSDYSGIEKLLSQLIDLFKEKAIGISLPSLKAKAYVGHLSSLIASIRKTGLTFAPEAGSRRLRDILGKDFSEEVFFQSLERSYRSGYRHVKLYFMIGLPSEEYADLDAIIDFSLRTSDLKREINRAPAEVKISINPLVPRPHTPLQWFSMENIKELKLKEDYLRKRTRSGRLKLSIHDPRMSFLEGVLSRGDRRLSEVILRAFRNGARFDAWNDQFCFDKWLLAFEE